MARGRSIGTIRAVAYLKELATLGTTRAEAARLLGVSYGLIVNCERYGVRMAAGVRGRVGRHADRIAIAPAKAAQLAARLERDADIVARFRAGQKLEEIGAAHGLTRERARQIAARGGQPPRSQKYREKRRKIAERLAAAPAPAFKVAQEFGVSFHTVQRAAKEAGVDLPARRPVWDCAEVAAMADKVRAGASIRAAAGGDLRLTHHLLQYTRHYGIASQHGRHRDFTLRRKIITGMIAAGAEARSIAAAVGAAEGNPITVPVLYAWASRHGLDLCANNARVKAGRERGVRLKRAKVEKPQRAPRPAPVVAHAPTPKDMAILNYGKAPASAIAAACGVSRNSIIGHWFRARQQGLIAS